jgi:hypothetical protein
LQKLLSKSLGLDKAQTSLRAAAFHLVNPSTASWASLIPAIQAYYSVEPVDFHSWLKTLVSFSNPTETDLQDKPALKILDFYKGVGESRESLNCPAETTKSQAASETMRSLGPINATLMENWLKQWNF